MGTDERRSGRAGRLTSRLDAICRGINAPLTGALPAIVFVGLIFTGGFERPSGHVADLSAACDPARAYAEDPGARSLGPNPHAHLCHARALQDAAEVGGGS